MTSARLNGDFPSSLLHHTRACCSSTSGCLVAPMAISLSSGTSIVASRHLLHHYKAHIHATDRILFTIASIFRRPLLPFGMGSMHYPFACFVAEFKKSQCPCAKSLAFSESWNCSSFSRFCICNIRWPSSPS